MVEIPLTAGNRAVIVGVGNYETQEKPAMYRMQEQSQAQLSLRSHLGSGPSRGGPSR